jgi:hypothetical protein
MTAFLSDEDYKMATAKVSLGSLFGTIAVYLTAPLMISFAGWRSVFVFSAVCGIFMLIAWSFLALDTAVKVEKAMGNDDIAAHWAKKAEKLRRKIFEKFWCAKRGLLSDTPEMKHFSEHAQALGIISGVLEGKNAELALNHLLEDKDLARCTVYFSYYLFEAFFKMDRGDLFLKRLDLWRDYLKLGVTTLLERPENEKIQARSDCHAWGAHPIWFMQTGLAGIKSAGTFFSRVHIKPSPGPLKEIKASHPHPKGMITVDLKFDGAKVSGYVDTPVEGVFEYKDFETTLKKGRNTIRGN